MMLSVYRRARPLSKEQIAQESKAPLNRRVHFASNQAKSRAPMVGGTITISLNELKTSSDVTAAFMRGVATPGIRGNARALNLGLDVKWEIGEFGVSGGWKHKDLQTCEGMELVSYWVTILSKWLIASIGSQQSKF
jgi:hypothetical protein